MYQIDLNSDLGESFGRYTIGNDDKIIPLITSANVACGYHASDPVVMMETIQRAKEAGMDEHIAKPVDGKLLVKVISELVKNKEEDS